jgi:hypothetical protein
VNVNGTHPDDLELFEYVEGDLEGARRPRVAAHLAACAACAAEVERLEVGRDALRAAPLLNMPPKKKDELFERLSRRERPASFGGMKRLVAILTPVAAVAVVVGVIASGTRLGDDDEARVGGGAGDAALTAPADQGGAEAESAQSAAPAQEETARDAAVRSVAGPPARVVELLRAAGYESEIVNGGVEARGATEREVLAALDSLPDGPVPVYVR